ncbi:hypothetical protein [Chromobacterium sp.]|uniref:hypothetical protein n=1 Tax=Chromobacterium sp. TaxID=306190 RepID=UPI0035AF8FB4
MAVLIEGISVVIRCRSIVEKVPGGIAYFMRMLPNKTLRSDGELACVHFVSPHETRSYVEALSGMGLRYKGDDGAAVDLVVVDQMHGPMVSCDWLGFGCADWDDDPRQPVAVCFAPPAVKAKVMAPEGWRYADSLSANGKFVAGVDASSNLVFLRQDDGVDVFVDRETGKEFFLPKLKR